MFVMPYVFSDTGTEGSGETVYIKRRVVVIPFFNSSKKPEFAQYSTAISDSIAVNLSETNMYHVSNQADVDAMLEDNNIIVNDFVWEGTAVEVAELFNADVVVFGFYSVDDETMTIYFNALDAESRRSAITFNASGNTGLEVIDTIEVAVDKLAANMKEKLPAYKQKVKKSQSVGFTVINTSEGRRNNESFVNNMLDFITEDVSWNVIPDEEIARGMELFSVSDAFSPAPNEVISIGREIRADLLVAVKYIESGFNDIRIELTGWGTATGERVISRIIETKRNELEKNARFTGYLICNYEEFAGRESHDEFKDIAESFGDEEVTETETESKPPLSNINKAGIALNVTGGIILLSGIGGFVLFAYADSYISSPDTEDEDWDYQAYTDMYNLMLAGLGIGIGGTVIGVVMIAVGIPLTVYKGNNVSFNMELGMSPRAYLSYKF